MKQKKNKTGEEPVKSKLRWVVLLLWISLSTALLFVSSIVTEVNGRIVAGTDAFTNIAGKYCVKFDQNYAEEYWNHTEPRDWQTNIIMLDVHSAEDLDFDDYYGGYVSYESFDSPPEETKKAISPLLRFFYSGIRSYGAMKIYDSDGNVFKGTELALVQSAPCMYHSSNLAECLEQTLGFTNLKEYLTENEFNEIAEVLEKDPDATVALDRYFLNDETYNVYIPLSILVRGSDGSEKLHLTLERQKEKETEASVYTEEVFVHRPNEHFRKLTDFRKSHEAAFEEWIQEMQKNKDPKADREPYFRNDENLPVKGFGPFHKVATYYEGQELTTYTYFYCSMLVPFLRIFFVSWGVLSLPYWAMIFLIRAVWKQKKSISQN